MTVRNECVLVVPKPDDKLIAANLIKLVEKKRELKLPDNCTIDSATPELIEKLLKILPSYRITCE